MIDYIHEPSLAAMFAHRFVTRGFVNRDEPVTQETFDAAFEADINQLISDALWDWECRQ